MNPVSAVSAVLLVCCLSAPLSAWCADADFILLTNRGEVAEYDSGTGNVSVLTTATVGTTRHEEKNLYVRDATLAVNRETTLTLYETTSEGDYIAWIRPYGNNTAYGFLPVRRGGYQRSTLFDRRHRVLAAVRLPIGNGPPTTGTLPLVADFLDGHTTATLAEDCVAVHDESCNLPLWMPTNARLAAVYTSCSAQILQTTPYEGWWPRGQSPKIRCYRATEEYYTSSTITITTATLGFTPKNLEILGQTSVHISGGTSATAYVFVDRPTSAATFLRHADYSDPYVFDEVVAVRRYLRNRRSGETPTGGYAFYLRADHAVVETQLTPAMQILYADRSRAYFTRTLSDAEYTTGTQGCRELYRMPLSPQGCGQLEQLPDLPIPPSLMLRISWEDLP